ncbi:hypothetical protein U8335_20310 [Roseiconus lacunae]|uniref:hypothetical protein n=1 Tax=Roseiconus lacunae TaxID=2605694 RepID=UPI0030850069|nr:hypothetical protein U8335_20310 [Stieleria sp. HD01]
MLKLRSKLETQEAKEAEAAAKKRKADHAAFVELCDAARPEIMKIARGEDGADEGVIAAVIKTSANYDAAVSNAKMAIESDETETELAEFREENRRNSEELSAVKAELKGDAEVFRLGGPYLEYRRSRRGRPVPALCDRTVEVYARDDWEEVEEYLKAKHHWDTLEHKYAHHVALRRTYRDAIELFEKQLQSLQYPRCPHTQLAQPFDFVIPGGPSDK